MDHIKKRDYEKQINQSSYFNHHRSKFYFLCCVSYNHTAKVIDESYKIEIISNENLEVDYHMTIDAYNILKGDIGYIYGLDHESNMEKLVLFVYDQAVDFDLYSDAYFTIEQVKTLLEDQKLVMYGNPTIMVKETYKKNGIF